MLLGVQASKNRWLSCPLSNIRNKIETEGQYSYIKKKKKKQHYKIHLTKVKRKAKEREMLFTTCIIIWN